MEAPDLSAFPPKPGRLQWLAPLVVLVVLIAVLGAIIVLSRRAGTSDAPPEAGPFQRPALTHPTEAWDVSDSDGSRLALARGSGGNSSSRDLPLVDTMSFDGLLPATIADVQVGDWITAIGVPNDVRSFAIKAMVDIPGGGTPDHDGFLRTPGGFAGNEALRDPVQQPFAGGVVQSIDGTTVTVQGLAGTMQFDILPGAPLRKLKKIAASDIHPGDRVAYASGADESTMAVLVFPAPPPDVPKPAGAGGQQPSGASLP
jgi:hypothetical protein